MSTALYRRYRPSTFSDVIGQEHVTEPLMQALRTGRIGHAYLFSGPRGCGKTTSARILARCLNCEQGPTPTPCGVCPSCVALATGGPGSVDVIEIDAASHGGVDDARDLREKAAYGPAQSRFKVYIIDEAHMVTPQGFNALLKIVEEPPEHVKFVFATTEPEKVIGTIRSRTHHYPFRLVPPTRLTDYLEELCRREGVAVEAGVLSFVVRAGGGSVRDSLSVLDQLIAGSGEEGLTYAGAAALLGFTEAELLDAVVEALAAGDGGAVFRQLDKVIETGHDPRRFVEDLLERFRDLIIVAASDDGAAAVLRGVPEDQLARMRQQAASFGPGELSRCADLVNAGLTELSGATSPRLQLELICARLLLPGASGPSGHAARLDRLERRLEMAGPPAPGSEGPSDDRSWSGAGMPSAHDQGGDFAPTGPAGREALRRAHATARGESADAAPGSGDRSAAPAGPQSWAAEPGRSPVRPPAAPQGATQAAQPAQAGRQGQGQTPAEPGPGGRQQAGGRQDQQPGRQGRPRPESESRAGSEARPAPHGVLDTDAMRRSWPDVLARIFSIRRVTWTFLSEHAQVLEYDGARLVLGIATEGLARTFHNGPHAEVVRQALVESLGVDVRIEGVTMPPRGEGGDQGGGDPPAPRGPGGPRGVERPPPPSDGPDRAGGWPADEDEPAWPEDDVPGAPPASTAPGTAAAPTDFTMGATQPDSTPLDVLDEDTVEELLADDGEDVGPPIGTIDAPQARESDSASDDDSDSESDSDSGPDGDGDSVSVADSDSDSVADSDDVPRGGTWSPTASEDAKRDDEEDDDWAPVEGPRGEPLDVFVGTVAAGEGESDEPTPQPQAAPGGKARLSAFERAKQALAAQGAGPGVSMGPPIRAHDPRSGAASEADDPGVSEDDEVITDLGAIGTPVIARVLGGIVIDEQVD